MFCIKGNAWLITYLCERSCCSSVSWFTPYSHALFMKTCVGHCCLGKLDGFNPASLKIYGIIRCYFINFTIHSMTSDHEHILKMDVYLFLLNFMQIAGNFLERRLWYRLNRPPTLLHGD